VQISSRIPTDSCKFLTECTKFRFGQLIFPKIKKKIRPQRLYLETTVFREASYSDNFPKTKKNEKQFPPCLRVRTPEVFFWLLVSLVFWWHQLTVVNDDGVDAIFPVSTADATTSLIRLYKPAVHSGSTGRWRGGQDVDALLFDDSSSSRQTGAGSARYPAEQVPVGVRRVHDVDLPRRDQVRPRLGSVATPQALRQYL